MLRKGGPAIGQAVGLLLAGIAIVDALAVSSVSMPLALGICRTRPRSCASGSAGWPRRDVAQELVFKRELENRLAFPFDLQPSCRQRTAPQCWRNPSGSNTPTASCSRGRFSRPETTRSAISSPSTNRTSFPRVLVFVDEAVANANRDLLDDIVAYGEAHAETFTLTDTPIVIPGGEACKNDLRLVECCWDAINEAALDRHSYVFVIGGGAVLDLVCFAASTAHRGIRHVRFPTTTLSQGDGGVGVKNGVNYFGKKNWIGSFAVPFAVVNDFAFLESLPPRERRNGIIEAIKVSLIRDRVLLRADRGHGRRSSPR
jgi:hypothetical protein